jgi:periplasmic divalent cation tolerance protein
MAEAYIVVLITTDDAGEGRRIARALVEERKAACVNIVPGVESIFRWEGKPDEARESLLMVKTKASLLPEVTKLVKQMHSNEVPEIISLPITGGNEDYLRWIGESVG